MAVDPAMAGMTLVPTEPYEISRTKIQEFAEAIGEPGGFDTAAPPTFPIVVAFGAMQQLIAHPMSGMALHRTVHGDQRFVHVRPLRPGDVVTAQLTVDAVRVVGGSDVLRTSIQIKTVDDELVCTTYATLVHTAAEASDG